MNADRFWKRSWNLRVGRWGFVWYEVSCAMHGAINIATPCGWLCIKRTTTAYAGRRPWYIYWSPNATPWAATFAIGPGVEHRDRRLAPIRRAIHGWRGSSDAQSLDDAVELAIYDWRNKVVTDER